MEESNLIRIRAAFWGTILSAIIIAGIWKPLQNITDSQSERMILISWGIVIFGSLGLLIILVKSLPPILNLKKINSGPITNRFSRQGSTGKVRFDTYYIVVNNQVFKVPFEDYESLSMGDKVVLKYFMAWFPFHKIIEPYFCHKQ